MVNLSTFALPLWIAAGAAPGATPAGEGAVATPPAAPELTLTAALDELERQNLTLVQARERAREASAVVLQATSPLVPTAGVSGSYVRNRDQFVIPVPNGSGGAQRVAIQPLEQLQGFANVRVPLVVPTAWFDSSQARSAAQAADAETAATRLSVRTGFAQAAYAARAAEEVVTAAESALADAQELTRSSERRVAAGTSAPLDVLKARTEEVARRGDLVRARADVDRARFQLGVLLGRAGPVRVMVPDSAPAGPGVAGVPEDALGRDALDRRPEVAAQRAQVAAADAGIRSAWARLAPSVSATGTAFVSNIPYPTLKSDGWKISVDLTWTFWDGGLQLGKRRQAEAQAAGARAAAEAERLSVLEEVHDSSRDLAVESEQLELAVQRRGLAAETAASARRSFGAGIASSLDVIDANDRLFTADVNLAAARSRLAQATFALARALGRDPVPP
jgi:outer membrane protein TolC